MFKFNKKIKGTITFLKIFTLIMILVLLGACTYYPITPPGSQVNGNIQIYSTPAGASIYLNGTKTGYTSPKLIKNIPAEGYLVTLKLEGYLNSNNFTQVYPNKTSELNVSLTPNPYIAPPGKIDLTKIEVQPPYMDLSIMDTGYIESITAYYSDNTNKIISTNECYIYSTKPDIVSVAPGGEISALSDGQANVWVEYTESNITKRDNILVNVYGELQEPGNLIGISVLPSEMSLAIGDSKPISSITAHYDSGIEQTINPNNCDYSVNNSFVSVSNSGIISGNAVGNSIVTVAYTENNITKTDTISVSVSDTIVGDAKYRALAVGVGDYIYYGEEGDLLAPPYDVNKMKKIFNDCQFGSNNIGFSKIKELKNTQATKTNILQGIQSTFSGADENDVSYFYFSGHGALLDQVSYLCPSDFNGYTNSAISAHELESFLSAIPGTKVVFIDTCHSGGFIGKDISRNETTNNIVSEEEYLSDFNDSVINSFARYSITRDLLTSSEYQVLTSSHWYQLSYELHPPNEDPFGVFTRALYEGCSLANGIPADVNMNNKISLNEAYNYIAQWVAAMRINQDVQVHPLNSTFAIFEY